MKKLLFILLAIMALCASSCRPTYNIIINPPASENKPPVYIPYTPISDRWNNSHFKTKIGCDSINIRLFPDAE